MKVKLPKDLDDVESGFPLVPKGRYHVEVTRVQKKEGQSDPYLLWTLTVIEEGDFMGTPIALRTPLSVQSLWKLKGFLMAAVGVATGDILDTDPVLGERLYVDASQEMYNNALQTRVDSFATKPLSEEEETALEEAEDDDHLPF